MKNKHNIKDLLNKLEANIGEFKISKVGRKYKKQLNDMMDE